MLGPELPNQPFDAFQNPFKIDLVMTSAIAYAPIALLALVLGCLPVNIRPCR